MDQNDSQRAVKPTENAEKILDYFGALWSRFGALWSSTFSDLRSDRKASQFRWVMQLWYRYFFSVKLWYKRRFWTDPEVCTGTYGATRSLQTWKSGPKTAKTVDLVKNTNLVGLDLIPGVVGQLRDHFFWSPRMEPNPCILFWALQASPDGTEPCLWSVFLLKSLLISMDLNTANKAISYKMSYPTIFFAIEA